MAGKKGCSGGHNKLDYDTHVVRVPVHMTRLQIMSDYEKARAFDAIYEDLQQIAQDAHYGGGKTGVRWYFLKKALDTLRGTLSLWHFPLD